MFKEFMKGMPGFESLYWLAGGVGKEDTTRHTLTRILVEDDGTAVACNGNYLLIVDPGQRDIRLEPGVWRVVQRTKSKLALAREEMGSFRFPEWWHVIPDVDDGEYKVRCWFMVKGREFDYFTRLVREIPESHTIDHRFFLEATEGDHEWQAWIPRHEKEGRGDKNPAMDPIVFGQENRLAVVMPRRL